MEISGPYHATSSTSSWRVFCEKREFIAIALFSKCFLKFLFSNDIGVIGLTKQHVTAAFSAIERESTRMGLAVNGGKIKYMLSGSRDVRRIDSQITADNYAFETVKEFVYLGFAVTTKTDVSLEIKRRITLAPTGATMVSVGN